VDEKKKKVRVVGTIGHVDHGKQTLVSAITQALDVAGVEVIQEAHNTIFEINNYIPQPPPPLIFEKKGRRKGQRNNRGRR